MNQRLKELGGNIKLFRNIRGYSQEQLALRAGLNTSYLGQIERGEKNPTILTLEKIAKALNISLLEIIEERQRNHHNQERQKQQIAILSPEEIKQYLIDVLETDKRN